MRVFGRLLCTCVILTLAAVALSAEKSERFDTDPNWRAYNNRSTSFDPRSISQDFGYSRSQHAGGAAPGEMGGLITPAAEAAYYAKVIPESTFDSKLTASGTLACPGEMPFHALIGFFNANSIHEWRTPNTIALRINGRGDRFFAYVEYATSRWRAGGDSPRGFPTELDPESGRSVLKGFDTNGTVHRWSITYDPNGNDGNGSIEISIDGVTAICHIAPEHRLDGATFNRFGILPVMKQWDSPGEIWLDDVCVLGELEEFSADPHWDGHNNRRKYVSTVVRPRFDFGHSPTSFAGGESGELGGLVFRGDIREPARMAYYADQTQELTLNKPLRASGRISLRRAVSDSGTLLGFFHSKDSVRTCDSQSSALPSSFLGIAVEGPSSEGQYVSPAFRNSSDGNGRGAAGPHLLPDASVHHWTLMYEPRDGGGAELTVALDGDESRLQLTDADLTSDTTFDRFGIISAWVDGNGQDIYFDDLIYTVDQEK